jgi:hypothetical protein
MIANKIIPLANKTNPAVFDGKDWALNVDYDALGTRWHRTHSLSNAELAEEDAEFCAARGGA